MNTRDERDNDPTRAIDRAYHVVKLAIQKLKADMIKCYVVSALVVPILAYGLRRLLA
jgi:hypothetical protein